MNTDSDRASKTDPAENQIPLKYESPIHGSYVVERRNVMAVVKSKVKNLKKVMPKTKNPLAKLGDLLHKSIGNKDELDDSATRDDNVRIDVDLGQTEFDSKNRKSPKKPCGKKTAEILKRDAVNTKYDVDSNKSKVSSTPRSTQSPQNSRSEKVSSKDKTDSFTVTRKVEQFSAEAQRAMHQWLLDLSKDGVHRLYKEFSELRKFSPSNINAADFPAHQELSRYRDVPCYDDTRVVLTWPDDSKNNFIHANRVEHELLNNRFICTQAPLENTAVDFWRMIWQEKTKLIIMLCNVIEEEVEKCYQYWPPEVGDSMHFDKLLLKTLDVDDSDASITVTRLQLCCGKDNRIIYHRHWIYWPDKGVPKTPMAPFRLLQYCRQEKYPVIVHCSAGVGRTGTLILTEMILNSLKRGKIPDSKQLLKLLRSRRAKAVQTVNQYAYAHYSIVQMLHVKKVFNIEEIARFCKEYLQFIELISDSEKKKNMSSESIPRSIPSNETNNLKGDKKKLFTDNNNQKKSSVEYLDKKKLPCEKADRRKQPSRYKDEKDLPDNNMAKKNLSREYINLKYPSCRFIGPKNLFHENIDKKKSSREHNPKNSSREYTDTKNSLSQHIGKRNLSCEKAQSKMALQF